MSESPTDVKHYIPATGNDPVHFLTDEECRDIIAEMDREANTAVTVADAPAHSKIFDGMKEHKTAVHESVQVSF